jgi:hypothetical protein
MRLRPKFRAGNVPSARVNISAPPIGLDMAQRFLARTAGEIIGPFDLVELAVRLRAGHITPATPVQRQGKTAWEPFAALPEFPILQAMPVETIAFHLEQKANALKPREAWVWYKSPYFLLFLFGAVVAVALGALYIVPPPTPPPVPKAPLPPWPTSTIGGFTIDCPVRLQLLPKKKSPYLTGYWADIPNAHFGVDIRFAHVPASPDEINKGFDQFEWDFLYTNNARIQSETPIVIDGHQGRDVRFVSAQYGTTMPGGLRMLAGGEELVMAWTIAHTKDFGGDEITRYITSFHFQ